MLSSVLAGVLTTLAAPIPTTPPTSSEPVRLPEDGRFNLLGMQVCLVEPSDTAPCDVRVFPPPEARPEDAPVTVPVQLTVLGRSLCLGPVPEGTPCDIRLAQKAANDPPSTAA